MYLLQLFLDHFSLILQDFFLKSLVQVKSAMQSMCQKVGGLAFHSTELGLNYLLLSLSVSP